MYRTPPIAIIDLPADNAHFTYGRPALPRFVILHATGGTSSGAWLSTTSSPPVSVHRLITKDGSTYKIVQDRDTAWGCGPSHMGPYFPTSQLGNMNGYALQIELEGLNIQGSSYPDKQIAAVGLQVAEWFMLYGVMPVLAHTMIDEVKTDPISFPWPRLWDEVERYWQ